MIKMPPPARSLIFAVVLFLFLSVFSFSTTNAHSCTEGFLSEAKRRNLVVTFCKRYQESNGVEIAMKLKEKSRRLDIMVGAKLEKETGWLAWGLNPGPEARMVGTQALIGIKNNSNLLWDTYNVTTYTKLGCQLLPSPIDLNISNFNFSYIDYLQYHVIEATIVLDPFKYDLSRLNHVWQVGVDMDAVGKEPKMHAKELRNYDSTETINLMTGKGRGNRVHTSHLIRQVHGILNIIGWGTLLPIGVLIARNFRESPLRCSGWKSYHISCQTVGYLVGSAGWAVGLWLGRASKYYSFPKHGIFGICIFTFATLQGCDGSVLLDSVRGKETAEKDSPINNPSLRGFEVIDEAKALLEKLCPRTVSCADILAFAARDSALFAGGISYALPGGRRDGRVSLSSEVIQNLPPPFFNAQQLQDNFKRKGLSLDEMVTLSGAHSIGRTHCSSFSNRLYGFNATHPQDPSLDPRYASFLKNKCPRPISDTQVDPIVNLDISTPNRLDNKYYLNLKNHKGLLTSDQTLFESPLTSKLVFNNVKYGSTWARKFAAAMVHMGSIEVLTGNKGEIRKNCHFVN
ncbi:uncharacterized protein [Nicotiana sylvestris]|uniref:uncharacterized protein isoform X1 n=1 Tax=Nicotiana sylvestris TaxID=4096 RepID=UPI00388CA4E1